MVQGRLRARWVALTAVAFAALAIGGQFAEVAALENVPPRDPDLAISFFPEDEELVALGWRAAQMLAATAALGFGVAALLQKPGRLVGAAAIVVAVVVLLV